MITRLNKFFSVNLKFQEVNSKYKDNICKKILNGEINNSEELNIIEVFDNMVIHDNKIVCGADFVTFNVSVDVNIVSLAAGEIIENINIFRIFAGGILLEYMCGIVLLIPNNNIGKDYVNNGKNLVLSSSKKGLPESINQTDKITVKIIGIISEGRKDKYRALGSLVI